MKFKKLGRILRPDHQNDWWKTHAMAPTAILLDKHTIRIYMGCWDEEGISRIGHVDVDSSNPLSIKSISQEPDLDIGEDGCFDENGVFPGHVNVDNGKIYLHYTGFQLGHKIRHYNFGGLAISENRNPSNFKRYSKAPILDRADEGLFVRAGSSTLKVNDQEYYTVYSAGSGWEYVGGKPRPVYNVFIQRTEDGLTFKDEGKRIIEADLTVEHGLGRPQILRLNETYYVFYTRRMKNMKYFFGVAKSQDLNNWERIDSEIEGIEHSKDDWDSEMIYFPNVIETPFGTYLFYSGNYFGQGGLGVAQIIDL